MAGLFIQNLADHRLDQSCEYCYKIHLDSLDNLVEQQRIHANIRGLRSQPLRIHALRFTPVESSRAG